MGTGHGRLQLKRFEGGCFRLRSVFAGTAAVVRHYGIGMANAAYAIAKPGSLAIA